MKLLLFTDNHFCETSSILRKRGIKYSIRLENQIQSLNWLEEIAAKEACDAVICLGDFFDSSVLSDIEVTALSEIKWNSEIDHYFLVGNHESSINDLSYNATKVLEAKNRYIISEPCWALSDNKTQIHFLPYILESNRQPLADYLDQDPDFTQQIVLSHNDLKDIQLGPVISKVGFSISEIEQSCNLFINGHLHNGGKITDKIINLGNLTGQNFSEDAFRYRHNIMILDTDSLNYIFIENPYAFNFYKINIDNEIDLAILKQLKANAVLSIKSTLELIPQVQELVKQQENILEYRIITSHSYTIENNSVIEELLIEDPIEKFIEFCKNKINNTPILEEELAEICQ